MAPAQPARHRPGPRPGYSPPVPTLTLQASRVQNAKAGHVSFTVTDKAGNSTLVSVAL